MRLFLPQALGAELGTGLVLGSSPQACFQSSLFHGGVHTPPPPLTSHLHFLLMLSSFSCRGWSWLEMSCYLARRQNIRGPTPDLPGNAAGPGKSISESMSHLPKLGSWGGGKAQSWWTENVSRWRTKWKSYRAGSGPVVYWLTASSR